MLGPLNVNLAEFGVSPRNGFLPDELPLKTLSSPYYESWEYIINDLPSLLKSRSLRLQVDRLSVLSTSHLISEQEWQRAYLILSFFTHSYIWEAGGPSENLPPQISIPFIEIANHLGLPPTATYSATNLWNFTTLSPHKPTSSMANLHALHTFTGSRDEEWFYLISVAIEAKGAIVITEMLKAMDAVRSGNSHIVLSSLIRFGFCVREIGLLIERMDEHCSPDVFYNDIRPFLAGSKNMGVAGLQNGVFYDEGEGKGEWKKYSGGSNAQSSLIQFFDIVLGVEHSLTGGAKGSKNGFLDEMRNYMPGTHRAFLSHISDISNIRPYVSQTPILEITEAYNFAVDELKKFRDIHIQLITRYIINPSRKYAPSGNQGLNLAVATAGKGDLKGVKGTGGTDLLPFLKQSRDETRETALE